MFRVYACVKQTDSADCGAACLATVARTHRMKVELAEIRRYAGSGVHGTNVLNLIQAAKQIGFDARGIRAAPDQLDCIPVPCVAHVVISNLEHYVVIHRVTSKRVMIADPARGVLRMPLEQFFRIWTGVIVQLTPARTGPRGLSIEVLARLNRVVRRTLRLD
ncbi:MAG TPA: cysteine peptidase family C39 domain-containing protein [Blastocatellia bacterium]|nr:cysteine peptidase family C39 domain-containing protein [Blastocatellia bacterium]